MRRKPTFWESISCLLVMGITIGVGFGYFKIGIQPLLILSDAYAAYIGKRVGLTWGEMEKAISVRLGNCMPAIFILFAVGIVIGTWVYSGTVPMMIYYGLKIINPTFFLVTAFIIVSIVSVATGTAWGSTATAGVALMGIASELGIPLPMAAGAIIAGGVFGDKLSPLSDTTNLAAMVCEVNLFDHIKHMLYTTIPASIVGMLVFLFVGFQMDSNTANNEGVVTILSQLDSIYNWNVLMLLPFVVIFWGAFYKKPTVPIMLFSSIVAVFVGMFSNGFSFVDGFQSMVNGFNVSMIHNGIETSALSEAVSKLINRGGIFSMTTIAVTIICGYAFAGIVEAAGCLDVILDSFYSRVKSVAQLIGVTILGSAAIVFTAGVASISIIMIGTLLKDAYIKMGLHPKNLSRTLEDAGTMLLPFVPWGVSGIFYLEVLGVGPGSFWIWAIPCYLCIVFAMIYGITGIGIAKVKEMETSSKKTVIIE